MNRVSWILIGLLLFTNVVWFLSRETPDRGSPDQPTDPDPRPAGSAPDTVPGRTPPSRPGTTPPAAKDGSALGRSSLEKASTLRKEWTEQALEEENDAARKEAQEKIARALKEGAPEESLAALQSLTWLPAGVREIQDLLPLVEPYLHAENPRLRQAAVLALSVLKPGSTGILQLLALIDDPSRDVRKVLPGAVLRIGTRGAEMEAAELIRKLLEDPDRSVRLETLTALSQAEKLSPELESAILSLTGSADRSEALRAMGALSGPDFDMSPSAVETMLLVIENGEPEEREAARRALASGIPETMRRRVADRAFDLLRVQTDLPDVDGNLRLLEHHGDGSDLAFLASLAENRNAPKLLRRRAKMAIEAIEDRERR